MPSYNAGISLPFFAQATFQLSDGSVQRHTAGDEKIALHHLSRRHLQASGQGTLHVSIPLFGEDVSAQFDGKQSI